MKYCSQCGKELPDEARFCFNCGATTVTPVATPTVPTSATGSVPPPPPTNTAVSASATSPTKKGKTKKQRSYDNELLMQGVLQCDDGKYRWIYELNMWKNPTILFLVFKIFFWIFIGIWACITIFTICDDGWDWDRIWDNTWPFLILMGVFAVITLLAYAIVAAMYGGKYTILFTMDEQCVIHEQISEQAKKAKQLGWLTAAAGAATGKPAMVGLGVSTAARTSMSSSFSDVRSVKANRGRNLIKIREVLSSNHVYVRDEDFDFVYNYIKSRCPKVR